MSAAPPVALPRARIPSVHATISRQYILNQCLQTIGGAVCDTTTNDFLSDEIIAAVTVDIPPHGDKFVCTRRKFYGDPSMTRSDAIESAHASALHYLQTENVVFVDDANLHELRKCQRNLLQATAWSDAFEDRCTSQKIHIAAMAEHIRLITLEAPLSSSSDDDIGQDAIPENVASPPLEDDLMNDVVHPNMASPEAVNPLVGEIVAAAKATPVHDMFTPEELFTGTQGTSSSTKAGAPIESSHGGAPESSARRALLFDAKASSST